MISVSAELVMETLREVVAERPDYVYEVAGKTAPDKCKYVHNNAPSCLVGHVLYRLGVPLSELAVHDGRGPGVGAETVVPLVLNVSYRATGALCADQSTQDRGYTWSRALVSAEEEFANAR